MRKLRQFLPGMLLTASVLAGCGVQSASEPDNISPSDSELRNKRGDGTSDSWVCNWFGRCGMVKFDVADAKGEGYRILTEYGVIVEPAPRGQWQLSDAIYNCKWWPGNKGTKYVFKVGDPCNVTVKDYGNLDRLLGCGEWVDPKAVGFPTCPLP